jgi:hypothetical protein
MPLVTLGQLSRSYNRSTDYIHLSKLEHDLSYKSERKRL